MSDNDLARQRFLTTLQTVAIAAALAGLLLLVGYTVLGWIGLLVVGSVVAMTVAQSTQVSLRVRPADAVGLRYADAPWLFDTVAELCRRAGISQVPDLYYSRSPIMNAATLGTGGTEHSILVTVGLMSSLAPREIAGVLAHEVAHIRNNDLTIFRLAEIARVMTHSLAQFGWLALLLFLPFWAFSGEGVPAEVALLLFAAPLGGIVLQLALFRTREFAADATAAELTGDPVGLASALRKIDSGGRTLLGQLFPFQRTEQNQSLFQTHPNTAERVKRLLILAHGENRRAGGQPGRGRPANGLFFDWRRGERHNSFLA